MPLDYRIFRETYDEDWLTAWSLTERLIIDLDRTVREAGGEFAVMIIPTQHQTSPGLWAQALADYGASELGWTLDGPNDRLRTFLEAQSIPYLDLLPEFRRAAEATGGLLLSIRRALGPRWPRTRGSLAGAVRFRAPLRRRCRVRHCALSSLGASGRVSSASSCSCL